MRRQFAAGDAIPACHSSCESSLRASLLPSRCISLAPCQRVGPWLFFLAASQSSRRVQKAHRLRCPASGHLGTSTPLDAALLAVALTAHSDLDNLLAAPAHRRVARRAASRSRELGRIRKRTVYSLSSAPPASRFASQKFSHWPRSEKSGCWLLQHGKRRGRSTRVQRRHETPPFHMTELAALRDSLATLMSSLGLRKEKM